MYAEKTEYDDIEMSSRLRNISEEMDLSHWKD